MNLSNRREFQHVFIISCIYALRMMGLFMIFPVFSTFAHQYQGYSPLLLGIALGIYGLTQGLFQLPLGLFSDRFGRKPIIAIGLFVFAMGSFIAAQSHSMMGIIIGRALQGSGAIGSTLMAMVADLTSEKNRTPAMATIGITIGITFACSMVLGPVISSHLSISGIFGLTGVLALLGIVVLFMLLPDPIQETFSNNDRFSHLFISALKNPELIRLDLGIFIQHAILTASFVVVPLFLTHHLLLPTNQHWFVYLPILSLSFLLAIPFLIFAEKKQCMKPVFLGAISTILLSQFMLSMSENSILFLCSLFFFFCGFNLLEATLPSLISKTAPSQSKGTAMGIYSCAQFLGIFAGGTLGGWLYGHYQMTPVFLGNAVLAALWWCLAKRMKLPHRHTEVKHAVNTLSSEIA